MMTNRKKKENVIPVDENFQSVIPVDFKAKNSEKKREVYPFQPADVKKMIEYFELNEKWIHYLLFVISCNMARRVSDNLSLKWINFFNEDGTFRNDLLEIREDKTDKLASPHINSAVKKSIMLYCNKMRFDPSKNNYQDYVFMQLSGTHRGNVLTQDASLKAIKYAAKNCGINYNVGNHSTRKTFGMINRMLHPNDYDSMQILRDIYNHSSESITSRYIGLTKSKTDQYYDDMGDFFNDTIFGKNKMIIDNAPVVTISASDLRVIINIAYDEGSKNHSETDRNVHIGALNDIMDMIDELRK